MLDSATLTVFLAAVVLLVGALILDRPSAQGRVMSRQERRALTRRIARGQFRIGGR